MRKNCFFYVVMFLAGLINISQAEQKIYEILVKGNINVKEKEIRSKIADSESVKKGKIYSQDSLRKAISNVMELGYFDDVSVEVDTLTLTSPELIKKYGNEVVRITFKVKERPLIKKIEFRGNKKISNSKLKGQLEQIKEKNYLDTLALNSEKEKIMEYYRTKGYIHAEVDHEVTVDEETNTAKVIFLIVENQKVTIGNVKISGLKDFKEKKILGKMKTKKKKIYNEKTLEEDIQEIKKFYQDSGYESIEISTPVITENQTGELIYIDLNINEGPKYRIGNISFFGNIIYTEAQLRKVVTLKTGKFYSQEKVDESKMAISELYADKGYIRSEIEVEKKQAPEIAKIDIDFVIKENGIVYVDRIYIDGLNYTKEYCIKREIVIKEGEPLRSSKVRRSVERIFNLGFIADVNVDIQPTNEPDRADLLFTVTEDRPGMVTLGMGYSSVDKLVGQMQVSHMNIFGRAQRLNLLWEFGSRKQNYEISWTNPWFLSKPMSFGVTLFDTDRQMSYMTTYDAYKQHRQGIDLRLGPRISEYFSLLFSYSYEKVKRYDISAEVSTTTLTYRTDLTSSIGAQLIYDTRDYIFNPSRGTRNSLSLQIAGGPFGGDFHFYRPIIRSSWFFPTFWKFVLSANAVLGFIQPLPGESLDDPKYNYEKYFVGGPDSIRGYTYQELGPPGGGTVMFVGNIEYKFPIAMEKKQTILQGAIFYDFGGAWKKLEDFRFKVGSTQQWTELYSWDNFMKAGVGFGLRFTIPAFPIRLDWGYALHPGPRRDPWQFYFTIGQIF